jgi:hypothetical protein
MMLVGEQLEPRTYEDYKRHILHGLSEAQREWERETGAHLVVSQTAPYFSYTSDRPTRSWRTTDMQTRVININSLEHYDIYIGRQRGQKMWSGGYYLPRSPWHNPFKVPKGATLEEILAACAKYERYLVEKRPDLMAQLPDVQGKVLACWCKPGPCHGDVIARLAEELARTRAPEGCRYGPHCPHDLNIGEQDVATCNVIVRK